MLSQDLLFDSKLRGRLMLALQKAIVATFNKGDWHELGHSTGQYDYIVHHQRLLRSLSWGDEDYGACVFEALRYFAERDFDALRAVVEHPKIRNHLEKSAPDLLVDLGLNEAHVPIVSLTPPSAGDVIRRALADADNLLQSSGATSAVDRLHTALHGYLRALCVERGIALADEGSITAVFKALRTQHPALRDFGNQGSEIGRILNSFSTVIDALNTIRNHASVAHPNENLLGEAEALLVVNAVRTLFHYLSRKVSL
jgi:hypothetical protein